MKPSESRSPGRDSRLWLDPFSPAKPTPSPKHLALAPPGNDAGGSILAAKVAHFLAAVNIKGIIYT